MAADPEGKELKLYSQFQTEQTKQKPFEGDNWSSYFGPSDSFLGFSSPVESELGSYEIESDKDDDHTAELSRRMAQYMLQDEDNSSTASSGSEIQNKSWGLAGSPISTLWSPLGSSNGSSHGSPEGPSKEPSPPTTPIVADRGVLGLDISQNVFSKLEKMKNVCRDGETGSSSSSKDQARALKNQKRKQNQNKQNQNQSQSQQQFMKQRGSKPGGSAGTGVFLPRHVNYNRPAPSPQPPQPSKTKGSSTVLIPVRVLQALQLHYDRMDDQTRQKITGFAAIRASALLISV
ncbi:uncharacterized protein LOC111023047 isoform X2 [Momordica charantia]|uniref:Uncharacterized protein LOC111023047 isoform X2 n=1 Tax=Momordica charantia TaxID=3673 RepID=A0A6J1DTR5_MOMCH|nr:uncharacterized protein LOC111023047 isoform X2 [Momordica charantia]